MAAKPILKIPMFRCVILLMFPIFTQILKTEATVEDKVRFYRESRIIGGRPANLGEIPYQLQLRYAGFGFYCGAVLIQRPTSTDQAVLTAAHCITEDNSTTPYSKDLITVVGGITGINETGQTLSIKKILVYTAYNPYTLVGDLALLFLNGTFNQSRNLKPVELPTRGQKLSGNVVVSGWGSFKKKNLSQTSPVLLKTELPIVDSTTCDNWYDEVGGASTHIDDYMFCAGYAKASKGPCFGDGGGPGTLVQDGQMYLAGVISWGAESKTYSQLELYILLYFISINYYCLI